MRRKEVIQEKLDKLQRELRLIQGREIPFAGGETGDDVILHIIWALNQQIDVLEWVLSED